MPPPGQVRLHGTVHTCSYTRLTGTERGLAAGWERALDICEWPPVLPRALRGASLLGGAEAILHTPGQGGETQAVSCAAAPRVPAPHLLVWALLLWGLVQDFHSPELDSLCLLGACHPRSTSSPGSPTCGIPTTQQKAELTPSHSSQSASPLCVCGSEREGVQSVHVCGSSESSVCAYTECMGTCGSERARAVSVGASQSLCMCDG